MNDVAAATDGARVAAAPNGLVGFAAAEKAGLATGAGAGAAGGGGRVAGADAAATSGVPLSESIHGECRKERENVD